MAAAASSVVAADVAPRGARNFPNHLSSMLAAFLCLAGSTTLLFLSQPVPLPPSLFLSWLLSPPSLCNKPLPARAGRPRPRTLLACVRSFGAPKAVTSSAAASGIPGLLLLVVSLPLELASLAQKQVRIQFSPPAPLLHASSLFLVKKKNSDPISRKLPFCLFLSPGMIRSPLLPAREPCCFLGILASAAPCSSGLFLLPLPPLREIRGS